MIERIEPIGERESLILRSAALEQKKETRLEDDPSQDCLLFDDSHGIYGVFDGLGAGGGEPLTAAQVARGAIHQYLMGAQLPHSPLDMHDTMLAAFQSGRQAVIENGRFGMTTVTVAWFAAIEGQIFCAVANAGDSRSFVYDRMTDDYYSPTSAQNTGRHVNNYFGPIPRHDAMGQDEIEILPFTDTMRLMLCTDGISGDTAWETPSRDDFLEAFSYCDPADAAAAFCGYSRKVDDKSIIIVDLDSGHGE